MRRVLVGLVGVCALVFASMSHAGDDPIQAKIRKSLMAGFPDLQSIDEINKFSVGDLYEVRLNGTDIVYTDASGEHMIQGQIVAVQSKRNLTQEKVDKVTAVKFDELPLADAFKVVRGDGSRKVAVFEDPNCGYCKRFERDLQKIDNVTVYVILYPVLGKGSVEKTKAIHCAKDPAKVWQDWMVRDVAIPTAAECSTAAIDRNLAFGRKIKVQGTPTLIFSNGKRVPGAIGAEAIEKAL